MSLFAIEKSANCEINNIFLGFIQEISRRSVEMTTTF